MKSLSLSSRWRRRIFRQSRVRFLSFASCRTQMSECPVISLSEEISAAGENWCPPPSPPFSQIFHPPPSPRLALAEWLNDPRNPLPARVVVNRLWAMLFGEGIVTNVARFRFTGRLAEPPETAGLAGGRIYRERLGYQTHAHTNGHFRNLPPIFGGFRNADAG